MPQSSADDLTALNKRLDQLTQQLERATRGARIEDDHADTAPAEGAIPDRLTGGTGRFEERLGRLTADGPKAGVASRAAESVARQRRETVAPADDLSSALNQAIAEISLRQQMLDSEADAALENDRMKESAGHTAAPPPPENASQLSGLEQQLRQLTTQMESLGRPCNLDDAVTGLRKDLAEIGRTLTEALPRRAIEALESEVRALSERIDESRHSGVESSKLSGVEQGLAEVRDALHALTPSESLVGFDEAIRGLANKVDQIASTRQDPAALEEVQTAIPSLRGIASRIASDEALTKLADEVRELSARVERIAASPPNTGLEALSTMEQRIAKLTDAFEARSEAKPVIPPQLEAVIGALSDKLEQMHLSRGDHVAMGHLEDRIAKLVEKLDASDNRLDHLSAIERGLADLLVRLDELRSAGAIRLLNGGAGSPEDAPVGVLERNIAEIKEAQSLSERRTQETFEVVQGTLGAVVDRLATIETDLHSASGERPSAAESKSKKAFRTLLGSVSGSQPARPIDPSLPPDHPLEPGTRSLRERAGADQVLDPAADAAISNATAAEPGSIIAAARRALRASASEHTAQGASSRDKSGGILDRLRRKGAGQKIRSVLVGVSVMLIALATVHMAMNLFWPDRDDLPGLSKQNLENNHTTPAVPGGNPQNAPATTNAIPDRRSALPAPGGNNAAPVPPSGVIGAEDASRFSGPAFSPSTVLAPHADVTGSVPGSAGTGKAPGASAPPSTAGHGVPAAITSPALRLAAANGDPAAEYEIGIRFAEGRTVTQSFEEAARWLDRAARAGLVPAQFRLGSLYEKGLGLKKDIDAARKLYIAAAEKGHAKAAHNLAVLYAEGIDGKPDYKTAAQWFSRAANYGVADSQYNLGILYARGIGVEQNLAESYKWFTLAAGQGDQDAGKKRDDVAGKLDPQSLIAARLAAQTWTATSQPEEATAVKTPVGGWDKPVSALQPQKPKPRVSVAPKVEAL
jgi:localization factor PodJL